jgi:hypothetical protein
MPRHLRNAQLRRNLCGVAEALKEQPMMAGGLPQQQQQQQQGLMAPPAAAAGGCGGPLGCSDAAGFSPAQAMFSAEAPAAAAAGGSADNLRRSWEAQGVEVQVNSSEDHSSGRLPVVWGDTRGSKTGSGLPLLQMDAAFAGELAGAAAASGGRGGAVLSDLMRAGSLTEAGVVVMSSEGSFTSQQAAAAVAAGIMQQPPPPPPRQAAQQAVQQQQGGLDGLRGLVNRPAAVRRDCVDGISLLQYDQLQHQQQQRQQLGGWVVDPSNCMLPQQQQVAASLASGSMLYGGTWSDPTASTASRGPSLDSRGTWFDSTRGPSLDSRRSVDSRAMGYESNRPSLDSRGTSFELSSSVMSGLSPAVAAAVLQQGLLSTCQPVGMRQGGTGLLQQAGTGQGPATVAATVATLEQQIRQVELALAQEEQQQQQQLVSISEGAQLLGEPVPLQRTQSGQMARRLSLTLANQPGNTAALLQATRGHMSLGGAADSGAALQAVQQQQQHMGHFLSTGDLPPVLPFHSSSNMQPPAGAYLSEPLPDTGEMTLAHFMQQQAQLQQLQQVQVQQQQQVRQQQVQQLFQQQAQGRNLALLPQAMTGADQAAAAAAGMARRPSLSIEPAGAMLLSTFQQQQQQQLVSPVGVGLQQPGDQLAAAAAAAAGSINGSNGMLSCEVQGQVRELLQQQAALSALQQELRQELAAELHRFN